MIYILKIELIYFLDIIPMVESKADNKTYLIDGFVRLFSNQNELCNYLMSIFGVVSKIILEYVIPPVPQNLKQEVMFGLEIIKIVKDYKKIYTKNAQNLMMQLDSDEKAGISLTSVYKIRKNELWFRIVLRNQHHLYFGYDKFIIEQFDVRSLSSIGINSVNAIFLYTNYIDLLLINYMYINRRMRENQLIMNDFMLYDNLFKDNVCDILKEHTDAKINYSKYIYCESFESAIIIYRKKMTRNYLVVMLSRFIKSNKINISTKRYYNIKYIAHLIF
jgi:hypothetical protein